MAEEYEGKEKILVERGQPLYNEGEVIYADFDTTHQLVFVLLENELWQYNLRNDEWEYLEHLNIPEDVKDLEFGYNSEQEKLQLWSRGVGKVYDVDLENYEVKRVDQSHDHRNQYGHFPFYYAGTLHCFGGYGYWEWNNILTFFNKDIKEWSIQNVDLQSVYPEKRAPATGTFISGTDELFIYGGESTVSQRPDDQKTSKLFKKDIWKFSFSNLSWERILSFPDSKLKYYAPSAMGKVGKSNSMGSSLYDKQHEIWYIPMIAENNPDNAFFLKPVSLVKEIEYPEIGISFGRSNQFLPTNFWYDPRSNNVIVAGFDHLSNSKKYPVRIIKIASDSLAGQISNASSFLSISSFYYFGVFIPLLFIIFFVFYRKIRQLPAGSSSPSSISFGTSLNNQEKKLLKFLMAEDRYVESQEIEELLWDDIDSFDYQRRLRNDIIKSINQKFSSENTYSDNLIVRKKDPDDNRRYLYGISEELSKNADILS